MMTSQVFVWRLWRKCQKVTSSFDHDLGKKCPRGVWVSCPSSNPGNAIVVDPLQKNPLGAERCAPEMGKLGFVLARCASQNWLMEVSPPGFGDPGASHIDAVLATFTSWCLKLFFQFKDSILVSSAVSTLHTMPNLMYMPDSHFIDAISVRASVDDHLGPGLPHERHSLRSTTRPSIYPAFNFQQRDLHRL